MADFKVGVDVATATPEVEVTVTPNTPLSIGRHVFTLRVVDDSGNESLPVEFTVIVADRERPTAVLTGPTVVAFGTSFTLSGKESFDQGGGRIVRYIFTLKN
ncbi:MAG TPA: hypothetical protein VFZ34_13190 [Blastocatellia bacterium]|nr:hypothetical protein [Blastocatellia bacterium]